MNWQTIQQHLHIEADGIPGINTAKAIAGTLNLAERDWKSIQKAVGATPDGIPGQKTAKAIVKALQIEAGQSAPAVLWPLQSKVRSGTSIFGASGNQVPLVSIHLPYAMKLSWETSTIIRKISCHKLISEPLQKIFEEAFQYYGQTRIAQLGLDIYGGCFNDRKIIGGASKSMHSWGIAIDLDPDHNGLNTHKPQARFSKMEYVPFWEIVEKHGAVSLGRERDYDWMHFQFARLD